MATSVWALFLLNAALLLAGAWLFAKSWRQHLPFWLGWVLLLFYTWLTPLVRLGNEGYIYFNTDLRPWFTPALQVYTVAIVGWIGGTWLSTKITVTVRNKKAKWLLFLQKNHRKLALFIWTAFVVVLVAYVSSLVRSGHNLAAFFDLANPAGRPKTWWSENSYPWLESLLDSLCVFPMVALGVALPVGQALVLAALVLPWVLLGGLRYRLLLLVAPLMWYFLRHHTLSRRQWWRLAAVGVAIVALFQLYTVNRWAIAYRRFEYLTADIVTTLPATIASETDNARLFMATLRYREQQDIGWDYGHSMFYLTAVRVMPKRFFPEGKKPTSRLLDQQFKAIGSPEQDGYPAISNYEEYYFSFGYLGVAVGMTLLGLLFGVLPAPGRPLNDALVATVMGWQYQLFTRGYFPQQVELAAYLVLPWVLVLLAYLTLPKDKNTGATEPVSGVNA